MAQTDEACNSFSSRQSPCHSIPASIVSGFCGAFEEDALCIGTFSRIEKRQERNGSLEIIQIHTNSFASFHLGFNGQLRAEEVEAAIPELNSCSTGFLSLGCICDGAFELDDVRLVFFFYLFLLTAIK